MLCPFKEIPHFVRNRDAGLHVAMVFIGRENFRKSVLHVAGCMLQVDF